MAAKFSAVTAPHVYYFAFMYTHTCLTVALDTKLHLRHVCWNDINNITEQLQ